MPDVDAADGVSSFFDEAVGVETYDRVATTALASFKAREKFAEALAEYRRRAEQGAGEPLKVALGLLLLGRNREALEWFDKAPASKFRHYYAATAARALLRLDQALSELESAASQGWDRFEIDMRTAAIHVQRGQAADAQKLAQRHAQAGRDRADWYYVQGLLAEDAQDWSSAIGQYEKALTLDPEHADATFRCAWVYDMRGDDDRAIELYECLAERPRTHVNALINLAVVYEDTGQYSDALLCLQRVLRAYPNHTRARLFLKDVQSCREMIVEEPGDELIDRGNRLLETSVSEFELSVRARNCLKKMNVRTLGDLARLSETELLSFKNFGETSLEEIKALLNKRGLKLGQSADELAPLTREVGVPHVPVPPGQEAVLSKPVSELELSVRSRRCLQRLNINSLGELCQLTEVELLSTRNFGVTSLEEVKTRLAEHGLQLAPK